jgi:hypothetical protein
MNHYDQIKKYRNLLIVAVSILVSVFVLGLMNQKTSALSGNDFNPSRIIDDAVFYNKDSMSPQQIQQFLDSKVPTCDTNGTQMYNSTQTRAQWAAANSRPLPPYTCLKDYSQSVPTVINGGSDLCKNSISGGTKSSAQIIWDVAQACGINAQVLLVMLQKEQSLITDTWPWPIQYNTAMGYACPDSGPNNSANCNSSFFGFFTQVYDAAKAYRRYEANPTSYNYRAGRNNFVLYNPDTNCGGTNIFIQNQATANLYIYTPYQPNASALNNLYGTGDSCSAYGNRNFWRLFNDWFGSTTDSIQTTYELRMVSPISTTPVNPKAGDTITVSYTVRNFRNSTLSYQNSLIQCRVNSISNCDPSWSGATSLAQGQERTLTYTIVAGTGGDYTLTPYALIDGVWYRIGVGAEPSYSNNKSISVPDIRITSPISTTPSSPMPGESLLVRFSVKNFGTKNTTLSTSIIQCRFEITSNCDSSLGGSLTLAPNGQSTFSYWINPADDGNYSLIPFYRLNGNWYNYRTIPTVNDNIEFSVADLRLTGPIYNNPVSPIPGQDMTVSYTVRNFGDKPAILQNSILQCRLNNNVNCDTGFTAGLTINPGEERTFTETITSVQSGNYVLNPLLRQNSSWRLYQKSPFANNSLTVSVPWFLF